MRTGPATGRLAPIKLRIGLHTGEVQLRDEGNYAGSTINKTARLRDLAHGGQTVMSAATEELVEDRLPENAWLTDLGRHPLRDLPRPMRVAQLCHPEVRNDFPPLRTTKTSAAKHLPTQLTTFIGRDTQMVEIRGHSGGQPAGYPDRRRRRGQDASRDRGCGQDDGRLSGRCLVCRPCTGGPSRGRTGHCRTGAGLARPTGQLDHGHGAALCPRPPHDAGAGQLRTPAGSERCTRDRHVGGLLEGDDPRDESRTAPRAGEVNWRVPSLSLADEAIELFGDRARRARPEFAVTDDNAATVTEICRRLDGMPLAIELAAARVRALSLDEIVGSLHDRFRLLTGGARTAVRRQQTLRASVDWSHALLTESERSCSAAWPCSWADSTSTRRKPLRAPRGGAVPGARPTQPARRQVASRRRKCRRSERDTGFWKPCASTHWRSSASRAKQTSVRATAP